MFAEAMQAEGIPHSFYYSLKDSFFLNALGDRVQGGRLLPGQAPSLLNQPLLSCR